MRDRAKAMRLYPGAILLAALLGAAGGFAGCGNNDPLVSTTGAGGSGGGGCTSDEECADPTPVCDVPSGVCGECSTVDPSTCVKGQYCVAATLECAPGCDDDADCQVEGSGDALTCDVPNHQCVGCQSDAACPPGLICEGETCVPGCTPEHACQAGAACCPDQCIDVTDDPEHCGSCDPCDLGPNATPACVDAMCTIAECAAGFADCNAVADDGCETDLATSLEHCGGCDTPCAVPNGSGKCEASACTIALCETSFADCNGEVVDGCEVDTGSDEAHCGACDAACVPAPGSEPLCLAGACKFGGCSAGQADCNADTGDGCEIDLLGDPDHCGSCPNVCPGIANGARGCAAGTCAVGSCDAGYADCDKVIWSGCEALLATDSAHCGMCGNACPAVPNGAPGCAMGQCGVGACAPGYADCDGDALNGCEVYLADDPANCGACDAACPPVPGGSPGCSGFVCGLGACDAGNADCYGGLADGCETSLATDPDNCNACGTVCPAVANGTRGCAAGACGIASCNSGFEDCNASAGDGCEVSTQTDAANCSACGMACPAPPNASAGCTGGACGIGACDAGFSDCNASAGDGCELNTASDPGNCGGCGVVCGSGTCTNSQCVCSTNVLLLRDDSAPGSAVLANALTAAGYTVTTTAVPSYQYNGANPPLAGFGSVVILAGGPAVTSYNTDMPAAGQTAIAAFAAAGNGVVFTEWAAYQVAAGRWQTLAPLVLLQRTNSFIGQITFQVDPGFAAHPLWAGVPASFTFAAPVNVGVTKVAAGVSRIAGSPEAIDAVAIRDLAAAGRVVHISHGGNYSPTGWNNANVQKLVANAVGWSARCN